MKIATWNINGIKARIEGLRTWFPIRHGVLQRVVGHVRAVDDVEFEIAAGQTLALVGESGCGKTTVGRAILRLIDSQGGKVWFDEKKVFLRAEYETEGRTVTIVMD